MDETELRAIQRLAKRERMTTAEWVRQRLREARGRDETPDVVTKLAAIRKATTYRFPAPPIDQMLDEIEAGYVDDHS